MPDGSSSAYGEVTGHAHIIDAPESQATLLMAERTRFLRLIADVDLTHEEHAPIHLPAGTYEVNPAARMDGHGR